MFVPFKYNLRNLAVRRLSTLLTAFGIAVSVTVFIAVMALVEGIRSTFVSTGEPGNVLAIRNGAQAETGSLIEPDAAHAVQSAPGIDRDANGQPLVSIERIIYVNLPRRGSGASNVIIRGTTSTGRVLRPAVRLAGGRWFRPGTREITVSAQIADRFRNCALGDELPTGNVRWKVVGIFDAGQTAYSSEIWTSAPDIQSAFTRPMYSVILARTSSPSEVIEAMAAARFDLNARPEREYYAAQTKAATPIRVLGNVIAVIMAIGSAFAAMNTMYAAVASRVREVAVLRALGFSSASVAASFLTEAALLAVVGGILGGLLSLPLNGIGTGTTNWFTFSEMNFRFAVTPRLLVEGIGFALAMGIAGGVLPAMRASRLSPAEAMRAL
jgi:ABC-type lipoprotein release transport system permease subunit